MTEKDIRKLVPRFKFNGVFNTEWFEIIKGKDYCIIMSGLEHVDEDIKSPYHYYNKVEGENATERALENFTKWWSQFIGYNGL
jgi:hypothetical protein